MSKLDWAKKNRDFLIIAFAFLLFLILGIIAFNQGKKNTQSDPEHKTELVEATEEDIKKAKSSDPTQNGGGKGKEQGVGKVNGYVTEIKAEDIIKTIVEYGDIAALPPEQEIEKMPVGWFVYFVNLVKIGENNAKVSFDTLESGFGATVFCEVDMTKYPQFNDVTEGKKIWLAGTIEGVDIKGTGAFEISPEHIRFDGKTHQAVFPEEKEK